jgi:hypothetical protein
MLKKHRSFFLGFSAAIGLLLAFTVVAVAGNRGAATGVGPPPGTPASAMNVFQRAARLNDVLPASATAAAAALQEGAGSVSAALQPGALATSSSRLLLSDLGTRGASLYAFRTTKGQVCTVFTSTYGSAGCFERFTPEAPISWDIRDVDQVGSGLPAVVDGMVPNDVSSIAVVVGGVSYPAQMNNNAFFYELPTAAAWPTAINVSYTNGATQSIAISQAPVR